MPFEVNDEADLRRMGARANPKSKRTFEAIGEDRYRLTIPDFAAVLEVDRLRREHSQLIGELSVRCDLPGARSVDGMLSIADFNLSSADARTKRAKLLVERANTSDEVDWPGLLEEFSQRILAADRAGQPAVDLRELPMPAPDDDLEIDGFHLLRRHSTIVFGDGGTAKSLLGLHIAGRLAERDRRVAFFDWELAGEDHRVRLERLFAGGMPQIFYARCERALVYEVDRLRRIVRDNGIDFIVFDSVAFACDGPPEAAEVAARYFRAVRQIGGGSLHIAHINKGDNSDQKPFGSAFWHNGARSTWFAQVANTDSHGDILQLGLYNRKANLGRLRPAIGFSIEFTENRTFFRRSDVADNPELATKLTIKERMCALLKRGAMRPEAIAEQLEEKLETIQRTQRRHKHLFAVTNDGRIGLAERNRAS